MLIAALSPDVVNWLIALWLLAVGGVIGSFLNVVVYRLPAGMSIAVPGSHCPACKRPIRWCDNVPVLSWLMLGGRCRDCQARISVRYPIVEGITAATFLGLGVVECLSRGANLPAPLVETPGGLTASALTLSQAFGLCAYHLVLLCTLLPAALIQYDGHAVPPRLVLPALVVGLLAPVAWPYLHPVHVISGLSGWACGLAGATAGLAAGAIAGLLVRTAVGPREKTGALLGPAIVGLFLGWQAAVALTVASTIVHLPWTALRRAQPDLRTVPLAAWLALLTLGWILFWRLLVSRWSWLG